jgi:mRNA interferase HigB
MEIRQSHFEIALLRIGIRSPGMAPAIGMHIITRRRLREFARRYPLSSVPLSAWYRIVSRTSFHSVAQLRQAFPHADPVSKYIVFNIGGNNFRLITAIHFDRRKVYIRAFLTHAEFNKIDLKKGEL